MTQALLSEVSLCCIDIVETDRWLQSLLGLGKRGGSRRTVRLPRADPSTGRNLTEAICWWLDAGPGAPMLGLYQFSDPLSRLMPYGARATDIGITRLGFHEPVFDAAIARLAAAGTPFGNCAEPGPGGRVARVRTPDGVFIELYEDDPMPGALPADSPALRCISIGTRNLETTADCLRSFCNPSLVDKHSRPQSSDRRWLRVGESCMIELFPGNVVGSDNSQPASSLPVQGIFRLKFSSIPTDTAKILSEISDAENKASAGISDGDDNALSIVEPASGMSITATTQPRSPRPFFDQRPTPAEHRVESQATIAAPSSTVWQALNDHARMLDWIAADRLEVTTPGSPDPAGYGAVRILSTFGRQVVQQVTRIAPNFIGYRAIGGTPFRYHNGTVVVTPLGEKTRVDWTIRFETHDASAGEQLHPALQAGIDEQMDKLKAMVEAKLSHPQHAS